MIESDIVYEETPELIGREIAGHGSEWERFNGHKIVFAKKTIIFGKGRDTLYEVKLDNGRWCTPYLNEIN
ncbi:hypothetical protein FMM74_014085 [Lachnospiraceae bacterium MD308]|nr:hypothetical protein [Lachnospiraceae bacterium MD308]